MRNKSPISVIVIICMIVVFGGGSCVYAAGWLENDDDTYYNDGNVGIGISAPRKTLVIGDSGEDTSVLLMSDEASVLNMDATHSGGGTTNSIMFKDNQYTKATWYYSTAGNFMGYRNVFQNQWNAPILILTDSGRVGVNDSNADFRFEVAGNRGFGYLAFSTDKSNDGDILLIDIMGDVSINDNVPTGDKLKVKGNIVVSEGSDICIKNGQCLSNALTASDTFGNLRVSPVTGDATISVSPSELGNSAFVTLDASHPGGGTTNSVNFKQGYTKWMMYYSTAGNFLAFRTPSMAWGDPAFALNDASGAIGINDSSPEYALEIADPIVGNGYFALSSGAENDGDIIKINEDSNFGINNPNPTATLDVIGNIKVATGQDVCIANGNCLSSAVINVISEGIITIDDEIEISSNASSVLEMDATHPSGGTTGMFAFIDPERTKWRMYYSTGGNFLGFRYLDRAWNDPNLTINDSKRVGVNETSPDFMNEIVGDFGISYESDGDVMVVNGNGVGMGISEPAEKLEVDGNMKVSGNISVGCIGACE